MGRQEWLLLPLKGAANEKALDLTTGFTDYLGGNISVDRNVDADTADADALLMAGQECQRLPFKSGGRAALEIEKTKVKFTFGSGASITQLRGG